MDITDYQRNHEFCLAQAAELLGAPACALTISWRAEQMLIERSRLDVRRGLSSGHAHLNFSGGPKGLDLEYGIARYSLEIDGITVKLAKIVVPIIGRDSLPIYDFWAVPVDQHRRIYRCLRRLERSFVDADPPIMRDADLQRLWDNTIGFLRQGTERLKHFGIPQKRGVVLLGEPGNGKTMACRWLLAQCQRHGLEWGSVSAEEYEQAAQSGELHELFELGGPGIVLFDDLDEALQDRERSNAGLRRTTFLTELDGLFPREGIVFIVTSNSQWHDLDPAFRRPGRIDFVLKFPRPDASLRRRFLSRRWQQEITDHLDIDHVVEVSEGMSFAELDELRKLLVLHYLDTGRWDWSQAWTTFREGRDAGVNRGKIGFVAPGNRETVRRETAPLSGA
jgi:hypothetical protein